MQVRLRGRLEAQEWGPTEKGYFLLGKLGLGQQQAWQPVWTGQLWPWGWDPAS